MLDKCLCDEAAEMSRKLHNNPKITVYYWNKGPLAQAGNWSYSHIHFLATKGYHKEFFIESIRVTEARLDAFIELHGLPDRWGFSHPITTS